MEIHDKKRNTITRLDGNGLTEKQEAFARGVANGLTLAEAYRRAYDADEMTKASIYSEASRLMDHPAVAARARDLMTERMEKTHALDAKRIRQHVFDRLMIESVEDDNPPASRIRALELLGKIDVVSMFKEQKGEDPKGEDNVAELEAKLKQALARLVDVTPSSKG